MPRPAKSSYPVYFDTYVNTVAENDLIEALNNQQPVIASFFLRCQKINMNLLMPAANGP